MNFNKLKEEFRQSVAKMNVAVDHNDRNGNFYEYGRLDVLTKILQDMGHTVDGSIIKVDSNMHRAIYMTIDGTSLGNFTGNTGGLFEIISPQDEEKANEVKAESPEEKVEP